MAIKRGSRVDPSGSSASMTDLIFLLLMFFMVATTLIGPQFAVKLSLPKSSNKVSDKPITVVSVTREMQYYVEAAPVPFDDLEKTLQAKLEGQESPVISLHYDKGVTIEELVKVINIAIKNNYRLSLATTPD